MTAAPTAERIEIYVANVTAWALDAMQTVVDDTRASGNLSDAKNAALLYALAQLHESAVRVAGVLEVKDAG